MAIAAKFAWTLCTKCDYSKHVRSQNISKCSSGTFANRKYVTLIHNMFKFCDLKTSLCAENPGREQNLDGFWRQRPAPIESYTQCVPTKARQCARDPMLGCKCVIFLNRRTYMNLHWPKRHDAQSAKMLCFRSGTMHWSTKLQNCTDDRECKNLETKKAGLNASSLVLAAKMMGNQPIATRKYEKVCLCSLPTSRYSMVLPKQHYFCYPTSET